jgi:hypothetical protein
VADNPGGANGPGSYTSPAAVALGRSRSPVALPSNELRGAIPMREQLADIARLIDALQARSGGRIEIDLRCSAEEPVVHRTVIHVPPKASGERVAVDVVSRRRIV